MSLEIETPRLSLRPFQSSDVEAVHALWTDEDVRRYLWDGEIVSLEHTRQIQRGSGAALARGEYGLFVARLTAGDAVVGLSGYWPFREPPEVEILWIVAREHQGRGYATEMACAMLDFGFHQLDFASVQASTDAPNLASVRVAERLGMSPLPPREGEEGQLFYRLGAPSNSAAPECAR